MPPLPLQPAERRAGYPLWQSQLPMNCEQPAGSAAQGMAVAVAVAAVNELETPTHPRQVSPWRTNLTLRRPQRVIESELSTF